MLNLVKHSALFVFIIFFCFSICSAQTDSESDFTRKGKLLSEGDNYSSNGNLTVTSCRLEEIELIKPVKVKDQKTPVATAFRIVLTTEKPLPPGDYSIWVDYLPTYAMKIRPDAVASILYERTLADGATLAISKREEQDLTARSVLSKTLSVPTAYATPLAVIEANQPIVKLRRLEWRTPHVEIRVERFGEDCYATHRNLPLRLEIDGGDVHIGCADDDDEAVIGYLSVERFAQLRDGANLVLKYGFGKDARMRRVIGRLNKSLIE